MGDSLKWAELKSFSFKDLISIIVVLLFCFICIAYTIFFIQQKVNNLPVLLSLISALIPLMITIIGVYGGTEGLELIKNKFNEVDSITTISNTSISNNSNI